jgi:AraC family transcriptional regulator of adaptative response/methylated-DNA-[protein]-cysteine methyltransferase
VIHYALGRSSLGIVLVALTEKGVCAITLGDSDVDLVADLGRRFGQADIRGPEAGLRDALKKVIGLIEEPAAGLDLPLDIRGTAFQAKVWAALRQIPAGTTASYREVARQIGQPTAARAVAKACADNALAIAVPCHRVVRTDGGLSGYRWGVEKKREILRRESRRS